MHSILRKSVPIQVKSPRPLVGRRQIAARRNGGSDSNGAESHAKGRSPDSLAVADRPVGRRSRSGTSHMD